MGQPASGAKILYGLRRELEPGVPDLAQSRIYYRPAPPLTAKLVRTLNPSPEINASGFRQRGIPGAITGATDLAFMLTPATFLEPLEHVFGQLAKTEPEADIFQYVGTPLGVPIETTFDEILSESPVARTRRSMGAFSGWTVAFANNAGAAIRLAGLFGYDTHMGEAVDDVGNTGTYTEGPDIRGNLRKPRDGEYVAIDITRDVAGGGLQYKAERVPDGGASPTFPGVAIDVAYDADGNGTWQNLVVAYQLTGTVSVTAGQAAVTGVGTLFLTEREAGQSIRIGAENRVIQSIASNTALTLATNHTAGASGVRAYGLLEDAGYWEENYDPVEIIFPGDSTAHGDADVGDLWTFPTDWSDPSATYITAPRFTSAHLLMDWRQIGATTWIPFQGQTATWACARAVTPSQGTGSRHYYSLERDGELIPTLQVVRKYTDDTFLEFERSHEPFELRMRMQGEKMGTGAYRHSITVEAGAVQVMTRTAPVAGPTAVIETLSFAFNAEADGSAPLVVTVHTDRDYTVAT